MPVSDGTVERKGMKMSFSFKQTKINKVKIFYFLKDESYVFHKNSAKFEKFSVFG